MTKDITFSLPAEAMQGAGEAIILGDFNSWNPENAPKLVKQEDGSFKAVVPLEAGKTYHYRFLLDNTRWVNDYHAQKYEAVPGLYIDNCVITVPKENKTEEPVVSKKATIKVGDIAPVNDIKPVAAKTSKKAAPKAKASKTPASKNVKAKAAEAKAPKPSKTVKKNKPKANE
jgi:hypothetical protein